MTEMVRPSKIMLTDWKYISVYAIRKGMNFNEALHDIILEYEELKEKTKE